MFVIETLSKPPWQQQQKHGQTKDLIGTQIAQYVRFQISSISYLFSKTKPHKSPKFAWAKNRTSDGKLFTCHCLELDPFSFVMTKMMSCSVREGNHIHHPFSGHFCQLAILIAEDP